MRHFAELLRYLGLDDVGILVDRERQHLPDLSEYPSARYRFGRSRQRKVLTVYKLSFGLLELRTARELLLECAGYLRDHVYFRISGSGIGRQHLARRYTEPLTRSARRR